MPTSSPTLKRKPILIIDKKGIIGKILLSHIAPNMPIIFVTEMVFAAPSHVIRLPYHSEIPHIPDNTYAYIFVIPHSLRVAKLLTPSCVKKSKAENSHLLFLYSIRDMTPAYLGLIAEQERDSIVCLYGDLFGEENCVGRVEDILVQAKQHKSISLAGHGLALSYPVFVHDMAKKVLSVAEDLTEKSGSVAIFPTEALTDLAFSRLLVKMLPDLAIRFDDTASSSAVLLPQHIRESFSSYPLEKRIAARIDSLSSEPIMPEKKIKKKLKKSRQGSKTKYTVLFIFLLIIATQLVLLFGIGIGWGGLFLAAKTFQKGNLSASHVLTRTAGVSFGTADIIGRGDSAVLAALHGERYLEPVQKTISSGRQLSVATDQILSALIGIEKVYQGKSRNPQSDMTNATQTFKLGLLSLDTMQAENLLPNALAIVMGKYERQIQAGEGLLDNLPRLLGFSGQRSYLILFQNNAELRPGGGFIGSYGILHLNEGKIADFPIHTVYDADGQLKGHIEPPYGLKTYLGAPHWFLRDSNFSIGFPQNATEAMHFLNLETGEKVDGVIAIDVSFLQQLLGAVGSVYLPDYKLTVTAANFYTETQKHAEEKFFPGSTQKQDFLQAVASALHERMATQSALPYGKVVAVIDTALREKHALAFMNEPVIEDQLLAAGFSSSLSRIPDGNFSDMLGVVDANLGQNKLNYYVARNITDHISLEETGELRGQLRMVYTNKSTTNDQYGGDYKNYLRLVLPEGAQVTGITVNGQDRDMVDPFPDPNALVIHPITENSLTVEKTVEDRKNLFGFLVTVPQMGKTTVDVTYSLPPKIINLPKHISYTLSLFKQPGTDSDPYTITFSYPQTYGVSQTTPKLTKQGRNVLLQTSLRTDQNYTVELERTK